MSSVLILFYIYSFHLPTPPPFLKNFQEKSTTCPWWETSLTAPSGNSPRILISVFLIRTLYLFQVFLAHHFKPSSLIMTSQLPRYSSVCRFIPCVWPLLPTHPAFQAWCNNPPLPFSCGLPFSYRSSISSLHLPVLLPGSLCPPPILHPWANTPTFLTARMVPPLSPPLTNPSPTAPPQPQAFSLTDCMFMSRCTAFHRSPFFPPTHHKGRVFTMQLFCRRGPYSSRILGPVYRYSFFFCQRR